MARRGLRRGLVVRVPESPAPVTKVRGHHNGCGGVEEEWRKKLAIVLLMSGCECSDENRNDGDRGTKGMVDVRKMHLETVFSLIGAWGHGCELVRGC